MSSAIITAPEFLPFIAGEPVRSGEPVVLHAPYDGTPTATVYQATPEIIGRAIAAARAAAPEMAALSNFQRAELLERIAQLIRRDSPVDVLCRSLGHLRDDLACGGVHDLLHVTARAVGPLTADEHLALAKSRAHVALPGV